MKKPYFNSGKAVSKSWKTSGSVIALTAASRCSSGKSTIPGLNAIYKNKLSVNFYQESFPNIP